VLRAGELTRGGVALLPGGEKELEKKSQKRGVDIQSREGP